MMGQVSDNHKGKAGPDLITIAPAWRAVTTVVT
jgi:hypothetical protein